MVGIGFWDCRCSYGNSRYLCFSTIQKGQGYKFVNGKIPTVIITGASGFVGRNLLDDLKNDHRIFAIARRSQEECNAPIHPNIAWIRADISEPAHMSRASGRSIQPVKQTISCI
jgi:NADP-dependent 3-hydroxy acid dehydrogenase YdfG